MADAVVIGAGHNGLVAANLLADRGWDVLVLEEAAEPGGAVRSGELIEPGFTNDLFSAFYPLTLASPHIRRLEVERWGVRWLTSRIAVAHPGTDLSCPAIALDIDETATSLDELAPGDGEAWRTLYGLWKRVSRGALGAFFSPFPPVRAVLRLLRELGPEELLRFARFSLVPVRRLGEEHFTGAGGPRLLAGNALHADVSPEMPLSGVFGWILCSLGQQHGFPVPAGGAGRITSALIHRLEAAGGRVVCGERVERIECRGGRAVAACTSEARYEARRAIVADVGAPQLYRELLADQPLADRLLHEVDAFQYDNGTVKVDWTLDGPIPWRAERARAAGTVHVADSVDALSVQAAELAQGLIPASPYLVLGQYGHFDSTRAPPGKDTAWAYTHVPQRIIGDARGQLTGSWDERETTLFAARVEEQIESLAPGFGSLIRGRHVFTPPTFQQANRNLVNGAINGGTAQIHQQLMFRPLPGLGRAETPLEGLFLGSSSAHPGGGVHGAPGANAASAALAAVAPVRPRPAARLSRALQR
ncbi:MAG TPA: NAD(P)/FAD-dependent oxidoreductase [Thermoleophilaceae bacterium]|nr:NAD(P)/FAD-dependent oxidoreductase [Thermoleophilaceae bacterium]